MLRIRLSNTNSYVRFAFHDGEKRFLRTVPTSSKSSTTANFRPAQQIPADLPTTEFTGRSWVKHSLSSSIPTHKEPTSQYRRLQSPPVTPSRWAKHSLEIPPSTPANSSSLELKPHLSGEISILAPVRRSRISRFRTQRSGGTNTSLTDTKIALSDSKLQQPNSLETDSTQAVESSKAIVEQTLAELSQKSKRIENTTGTTTVKAQKPRRQLKPRKALITLTSNALENLRGLLEQPEPQLIRIGVKNRGCSGLTYHLEYVSEPGKFDEIVEQDGVRVVIDSKALFSIVGSEMDWIDDKLSSRFIFRNPNSKGTCGCGESFMV